MARRRPGFLLAALLLNVVFTLVIAAGASFVVTGNVLESDALPRALTQSDAAARAFELGALALPDLLLIRGQAVQARIEHVDAEFAAAVAGVELLAAAGWTP